MRWILIIVLIGVLVFAYFNYVEDWRNPKASFVQEEKPDSVTAVIDTSTLSRKVDRQLQEVVTIDMDEHEDPIFFTLEDIKAYYRVTTGYVKDKLDK